jgi:hypothetical protein
MFTLAASFRVDYRNYAMHATQAFYWMNVRFCLPMENDAMRANDTRYAVVLQTGRLIRWKPDSPAAAWYVIFLFTKKFTM